ncbi:MAG: cation transporter [Candidatus Omnitrophica bacterium]|nr:cation transporter [Candidatus Omnitrophota bacterium]
MTEAGLLKEKIGSLRWAIALSFLLTLVKGLAALFTASQALLASALDSLMDMGISSVNLLSVYKASKPPDEDHAYGHQKIESLASYSQGVLILIFAFLLFGESFRRTLAGSFIHRSELAFLAVGFSMGVNFLITAILQRAERRTGSLIVKTEKAHYFMDILSYAVIVVSLVLVRVTGWPNWDLVGGIFVGGYVVFLAGQILIQAANELVDRSLPQGVLDQLGTLIRRHDRRILGYHELRTRKAGDKTFIDFHLVLQPKESLVSAHEVTESLIEKIKKKFSNADVTIHEDPEGGM